MIEPTTREVEVYQMNRLTLTARARAFNGEEDLSGYKECIGKGGRTKIIGGNMEEKNVLTFQIHKVNGVIFTRRGLLLVYYVEVYFQYQLVSPLWLPEDLQRNYSLRNNT